MSDLIYFKGTVAGFSVEEWNTIAQILSLTWLLGVDGFYFFIEQLLIEMSVDFSRLKLLLSGDIEQNPGPDQVFKHYMPNKLTKRKETLHSDICYTQKSGLSSIVVCFFSDALCDDVICINRD